MKVLSTKYLTLIFLFSFIFFWPSLFVFYTNDDFFLIKVSQATNFWQFMNFFNLTGGPEGLGVWRPLTTQVFYFLGWKFFDLNPLGLHLISFITFFAVVLLIYKLAKIFSKSEFVALTSAFLYAASATHFGQLYYLALYQELGLAFFFLLSTLLFIRFIQKGELLKLILSFLAFIGALASREQAVVLPFSLLLVYLFLKYQKGKIVAAKKLAISIAPFFTVLLFYFFVRIFYYGFAQGESYIWDFSPRILNTLFWYFLWSLNLPEMLVDFVGPSLRINLNLFRFWSKEIIPIFMFFAAFVLSIIYLLIKTIKSQRKTAVLYIFCASWFVLTLGPLLFLPLHKFAFYLTVPLFGIVLSLSILIEKAKLLKSRLLILFAVYFILSILTLNLTHKTHWITQGAQTAKRVHNFFETNKENFLGKRVVFFDVEEDKVLPWSPTKVLETVLSGNNFFEVFYGNQILVSYGDQERFAQNTDIVKVKARDFLGY